MFFEIKLDAFDILKLTYRILGVKRFLESFYL